MSVDLLRAYLRRRGIEASVHEYEEPVETVAQAASVAGVPAERIVKSLVCVDGEGRACVCIVPGPRRLDLDRAAAALGVDGLRLARGEEVRRATGYPVGAVPPVGHPRRLPVLLDASIPREATVVAGGGSTRALVEIGVEAIEAATGARRADLSA